MYVGPSLCTQLSSIPFISLLLLFLIFFEFLKHFIAPLLFVSCKFAPEKTFILLPGKIPKLSKTSQRACFLSLKIVTDPGDAASKPFLQEATDFEINNMQVAAHFVKRRSPFYAKCH